MNKVLNPLVRLKSEEEIKSFLNVSMEHSETSRFVAKKGDVMPEELRYGSEYNHLYFKTRVIVFVYDEEEYEQELEAVAKSARYSSRRIDIRYGIVTNRNIIKHYKKTTGWFPEGSLN